MKITVSKQYDHYVAVDDDTYDGPGSPVGSGRTEMEAVNDLVEQIIESLEEKIDDLEAEIAGEPERVVRALNRALLDRLYSKPAQSSHEDDRQGASGSKTISGQRGDDVKVTTGPLLDGFPPLQWFDGEPESRCMGRMPDESEDTSL